MSSSPKTPPPPRAKRTMSMPNPKVPKLRGAAGMPYRTAKLKRVFKLGR
jgi:hypothetical protein